MKPRFSIFAILALTAYAAVAVMGAIAPDSPGSYAVFLFWIVFVYQSFRHLTSDQLRSRNFAKGFLLASLAIIGAEMLGELMTRSASLALSSTGIADEFDFTPSAIDYRRTLAAHSALWLAVGGGVIAMWRGNRREQPERSDSTRGVDVQANEAIWG
jgi:hypothetical protein